MFVFTPVVCSFPLPDCSVPRHKLQLEEPTQFFNFIRGSFVTRLTACPRPKRSLLAVPVSLAHPPATVWPLTPAKCDWAGTRHKTDRLSLLKLRKFHFSMRKNFIWRRQSTETGWPRREWSLPLWSHSKPTCTHSCVTCNLLEVTLPRHRGWTRWSPFQPSQFWVSTRMPLF